jgi:hypothetical protein
MHYKYQPVNAVRGIIVVYSDNHTKHVNTQRWPNAEIYLMFKQMVNILTILF